MPVRVLLIVFCLLPLLGLGARSAGAAAAEPSRIQQAGARAAPAQAPKARPREAWRSHVIQVHPGVEASFLLRGRQYQALNGVRALRYQPARSDNRRGAIPSALSDALLASSGARTVQGQWVDVRVARDAAPGLYWLEGLQADGKAPPMALPALIEVVPAGERLGRISPRPKIPAPSVRLARRDVASSPVARRQKQETATAARAPAAVAPAVARASRVEATGALARAQVSTLPLSGNPLLEYDPLCEMNSTLMQQMLDLGGSMPCRGNAYASGPSTDTYLLSHSPEGAAAPGAVLTIIASNLTAPASVRVSLAGQLLPVLTANTSRLEVRLPDAPVTGALVVFREGGEVLGHLNDAYQVVAPAQPPLFADFSGTQTQVSWKLGYQMALLSWLAYFDNVAGFLADNPGFAARLGLTVRTAFDETRYGYDVCHLASGSMQGVVFEHGPSNSVMVAVRGSQTGDAFQDWWDNDLDGQPFPRAGWALGSTIHCGFHQAARVVFDELAGMLKDDAAAGRRIWLTGHSLGGASAMLLAAMLEWDAQIPVTGVYTFGAPGVGNAVFVNAYDADIPNTHRFELQLDPAVSLFYPVHGRPGRNHLLHTNGQTDLSAASGYLVYPGFQPVTDLMVTHMQYWCRGYAEMDEAASADLTALVVAPPPNPDGSGVCDVTDFYGAL